MERRSTDFRRSSLNSQPYTKVVGFKVEGAAASPTVASSLVAEEAIVGSPSPVIIPSSSNAEPLTHRPSADSAIHDAARKGLQTLAIDELPSDQPPPGVWRQSSSNVAQQLAAAGGGSGTYTPPPQELAEPVSPQHAGAHSVAPSIASSIPAAGSRAATPPLAPPPISAAQVPTPPASSSSQPAEPNGTGVGVHGSRQDTSDTTITIPTANNTKRQGQATLTRAQRRELQEKQRAEKAARQAAAAAGTAPTSTQAKPPPPKQQQQQQQPSTNVPRSQSSSLVNTPTRGLQAGSRGGSQQLQPSIAGVVKDAPPCGLALFSHLPPPKHLDISLALQRFKGDVHPCIVRLGLEYAAGRIRGADARCVAMLEAFKEVVQDYHVPEGKTLQRDLVAHLSSNVGFLVEARPLGTAMGNAIKYLKTYITHLDGQLDEADAREAVLDTIDSYIKEKVLGCCKVLVDKARDKIANGDVVLTYAMSSVVLKLLLAAKEDGKQFRVVVADARPLLEGREMMRRLLASGVSVTYCLTSGLAYIMREVTKVFVGAAAVLSNESHKFHERVQMDSITNNELGDPDELVAVEQHPDIKHLNGWQSVEKLDVLNLLYDAMPCEYVSMVCTEFGPLPPTSVPVILRESREEWLPL